MDERDHKAMNEELNQPSCLGAVSGSQICPNCGKEHDSDEWNGYCSKICWWGFPVDCL